MKDKEREMERRSLVMGMAWRGAGARKSMGQRCMELFCFSVWGLKENEWKRGRRGGVETWWSLVY